VTRFYGCQGNLHASEEIICHEKNSHKYPPEIPFPG
jgi:hypothetical protein